MGPTAFLGKNSVKIEYGESDPQTLFYVELLLEKDYLRCALIIVLFQCLAGRGGVNSELSRV